MICIIVLVAGSHKTWTVKPYTHFFCYLLYTKNCRFQPDDQRKIISVDNDSPPPPYSPPQNGDSLSQTLATLSVSKVAAAQQSNNHPQLTVTNRYYYKYPFFI